MAPQTTLSAIDSAHVESISAANGEPDWLRQYRAKSFESYGSLPIETSPLYTKYTDAARMDPAKVSVALESSSQAPSFLSRRLSELEGLAHVVQIGTSISEARLSDGLKEKGVSIMPITEALSDDQARRIIESQDAGEDRFTALNCAAFSTGIYIRIPEKAEIKEPIHFVSCLPEDGSSAISRNVISAGAGSSASIVQEIYSPKQQGQQAYLELLSVDAAQGSRLDVTSLQMMDQGAVNFSTRRADVARDASVNWYLGLFGASLSRYHINYYLNGPGASITDSEVVFGSSDQSFDIQANVNHVSPETEGRVVEKSILRDRSKSLFKGMIRIMEEATKSNSYLSGRSILLDPDAKSEAIPGLEILTNDVKATHSASVAQIDEEQIFYLQTRCLDKKEAERTIVEGFLEPLSRKMSYQVRAWIAYLIESKWKGQELSINTDKELEKFVEVEETRYNEDSEIEQHYKYR